MSSDMISALADAVRSFADGLIGRIDVSLESVASAMTRVIAYSLTEVQNTLERGLKSFAEGATESLANALKPLIGWVTNSIGEFLTGLSNAMSKIAGVMASVKDYVASFATVITSSMTRLGNILSEAYDKTVKALGAFTDRVASAIYEAVSAFAYLIDELRKMIGEVVTGLWTGLIASLTAIHASLTELLKVLESFTRLDPSEVARFYIELQKELLKVRI